MALPDRTELSYIIGKDIPRFLEETSPTMKKAIMSSIRRRRANSFYETILLYMVKAGGAFDKESLQGGTRNDTI